MEESRNMSDYHKGLDALSRKRYLDKINVISSVDPYELSDEEFVIVPDKYSSIM